MKQCKIGCIILAAGTGSRMGDVKQLLPLEGKTILEHVIQKTLKEDFSEIITVIGFEAAQIKSEIKINDPRLQWVENKQYVAGQSTSLKKGIQSMQQETTSFMVFLGDLPFIDAKTIQLILEAGKEKKRVTREPFVIRPTYNDVAGHPVFFGNMDCALFSTLDGDQGAKKMIKQINMQIYIDVSDKGIVQDIDTPIDYRNAKRQIAEKYDY